MATASNSLTALAAALAFALVACQPDTGRITDAHAADVEADAADEDGLLAEAEQDDANPPDDADPAEDEEDADAPDDAETSAVASAEDEAAATEQATAATDDALIDTREGGNPLADAPVDLAPVEDDDED